MTTFLSDSYDDLEENLTQIKSLILKSYPGENITDSYSAILVDAKCLDINRGFKPEHLGYITNIFEDTSDSRSRLLEIQR